MYTVHVSTCICIIHVHVHVNNILCTMYKKAQWSDLNGDALSQSEITVHLLDLSMYLLQVH